MARNEADAVRSARLNGKKMAIKNKNHNKKNVHRLVIDKNLDNAETKFII